MSIWWKLYALVYVLKLAIRVQYYSRLAIGDDPRPFALKLFGHLLTASWDRATDRVVAVLCAALELPLVYLLWKVVMS